MGAVKSDTEDADVMLLVHDLTDVPQSAYEIFSTLKNNVPEIIVLNKSDAVSKSRVDDAIRFFEGKEYSRILVVSATEGKGIDELKSLMVDLLPEGQPFFSEDNLTDLPMRFFVAEIIREKIFMLLEDEIPYQTTVLVQEYAEKNSLTKIRADIIVQRETQKAIVIGHRGQMIRKIGMVSRQEIESFIGRKVFLELFVKVRPGWRDTEMYLKEYGY